MRFECKGAGSCAWGVMPSPLHAVRMKRCGHLVPFRTKSRPRPRCGSRKDGKPGRAALAVQSYAVRVHRCGLLRMGRHAVAAPCGSNEKVWPPCSFSNKEPSKTTVWLPCSGHVQEQKRLPPRLANNSNRSLQGRRLLRGFMLRACLCLCGMHACFGAGSCSEAYMTLCACLCRACLCLCCMRARACAGILPRGNAGQPRLSSRSRRGGHRVVDGAYMAKASWAETATWVLPSTVFPGALAQGLGTAGVCGPSSLAWYLTSQLHDP